MLSQSFFDRLDLLSLPRISPKQALELGMEVDTGAISKAIVEIIKDGRDLARI